MRRTETPQIRIALLGLAASPSALTHKLAEQLRQQGMSVCALSAPLRENAEPVDNRHHAAQCAQMIERLQAELATQQGDWVIATTTPLSVAVQCDLACGDSSLYPIAIEQQRRYQITLLQGIESHGEAMPADAALLAQWQAFDSRMRQVLQSASLPFQVLYGSSAQRLAHALNATQTIANNTYSQRISSTFYAQKSTWTAHCAHCGDADCEHRLFQALPR